LVSLEGGLNKKSVNRPFNGHPIFKYFYFDSYFISSILKDGRTRFEIENITRRSKSKIMTKTLSKQEYTTRFILTFSILSLQKCKKKSAILSLKSFHSKLHDIFPTSKLAHLPLTSVNNIRLE